MKHPRYISTCGDEKLLLEAIESMLSSVSDCIKMGYTLDIRHLIDIIQSGVTLRTFNMMVLNLNKELSVQYIGEITTGRSPFVNTTITLH